MLANRAFISHANRLVVKVGSSSLTEADGTLNRQMLIGLGESLANAHDRGQGVALVSSGAVAAGIGSLGFATRPADIAGAQAAAMVGQGRLMAAYSEVFSRRGIGIAQVLLTVDDMTRRRHYANARAALERLFDAGIVPIVNENDAVATHELTLGDNDWLAALTAHLIGADALILLTDVDGLYTGPPGTPDAKPIAVVGDMSELEDYNITGRGSTFGTGGMRTKVRAAQVATCFGIPTIITSAARLPEALAGDPVGTWFAATGSKAPARDLWIAHAAPVHGRLALDEGAARAVTASRASLLAVGITDVSGDFEIGDAVDVYDHLGRRIARGLAGWSARELADVIGREHVGRPAVHADDLVLLRTPVK